MKKRGSLSLTRVAVGDHILLGGDNMDLALAHHAAATAFAAREIKLDAGQMHMLWHSCRLAKETIFIGAKLAAAPVTVLGRGSRVIGGTIKGELSRVDVEEVARRRLLSPMSRRCGAARASARSACRRSACRMPPIPPSRSTWPLS